MACQIHASCITARVWSKFGNSRITPLQLTTMESPITPSQNHAFSPALKRPDGMCSPRVKNAQALRNHCQSYARGRLSRSHMKIIAITDAMKIGAMKLCRFLPSAVNQANRV